METPKTHPFEIFVGSLATMQSLATQGVKGLNPNTHRWQVVSPSATYLVVKTFDVKDEETGAEQPCGSLFSDEDLRAIAKENNLIIP